MFDWMTIPARSPQVIGAAAAVVLLASLLPVESALSPTLTLTALAQGSRPVDAEFHTFVPAPDERSGFKNSSRWQDDMERARNAYRDRDFVAARTHLEAALNNGNSFAAWYLGHIWRLGLGVEPDQTKAVSYYRQVAMGYDPLEPRPGALDMMVDSLVRLGDYYRDGSEAAGIAQDPTRAYRLYTAAAGHGHPGAQFGLGIMYLKGLGVSQNISQALKWMMFAARKRFAPAETMLGDLYWEGTVVERDRAQAIKWYMLASETAGREANPRIADRLESMMAEASDRERQSGRMGAELWADRFPEDHEFRKAE
ncbi:MAG: tetratricopeptide repeat protein [Hyphomicrobiales bacterium]